MNGNYLIPANSKKSLKIFGIFYKFDLILFLIGVGISFILVIAMPVEDIKIAVISVLPGCLAGLLVFPVPHYHNVLTVIIDVWTFITSRQKFVWKGWCFISEYSEQKKSK